MSDFLFAYGTLQPDLAPAEIAPAVATLMPVGEGLGQRFLYDLAGILGRALILYPKTENRRRFIELPEDSTIPAPLDAYEEFNPAAPERESYSFAFFESVDSASGGTLQCWVYIYNRNPGSAPVIPAEDFADAP